jgi:uncharacterized protein (DUF1330 family)
MPGAYTVIVYRSVSDPAAVAAYQAKGGPAIAAAGGRFIARGTPAIEFENGLNQRLAIVAWPSVDAAVTGYNSEAYQAALACLGSAADRDVRIIEALDGPED